ncbi:MAG: P-loop NTPase [Candidatus Bathyarchaeia archaeon]|jgi:ATP-binding protein involved in chromosome partitioning
MVDPRITIVNGRLKGIRRIIAVSGGKGGVGKSLFASTFALILAKKGFKVGLFDLDFTSPSTHVILGVQDLQPKEEKGIIPPRIHGLKYMSIVYYSGNRAAPLRGADVSNALIELLSIVRWGKLDYLILDMPPGIGDATLDLIRLVKSIEFLIVTTPSQLAFETVKKLAGLLHALKIPVIGIVENMKMNQSRTVQKEARMLGLTFLGDVPYDTKIEATIGEKDALLETTFAKKVQEITAKIERS